MNLFVLQRIVLIVIKDLDNCFSIVFDAQSVRFITQHASMSNPILNKLVTNEGQCIYSSSEDPVTCPSLLFLPISSISFLYLRCALIITTLLSLQFYC